MHLLGPDMELVEEQLYELGTSHKRYGVTTEHFEIMGTALVQTLQNVIGKRSFTDKSKKAWDEIYKFMSMAMIQGAAGI